MASDEAGCEFCEIARHDLRGQIEMVLAESFVISPRDPVTAGHKLVIPMTHVADAAENPRVTAGVMRDLASYLRGAAVGDCNIITSRGAAATQTVFHMHVHIVPRAAGDNLALPWNDEARRQRDELLKAIEADERVGGVLYVANEAVVVFASWQPRRPNFGRFGDNARERTDSDA